MVYFCIQLDTDRKLAGYRSLDIYIHTEGERRERESESARASERARERASSLDFAAPANLTGVTMRAPFFLSFFFSGSDTCGLALAAPVNLMGVMMRAPPCGSGCTIEVGAGSAGAAATARLVVLECKKSPY